MSSYRYLILTAIQNGEIVPSVDLGYERMFYVTNESISYTRTCNIEFNRARMQDYFRSKYWRMYDFVFLIDADVIVTRDDLQKLIDAWKPGTTPCINTKGKETNHVVASCCLLSVEDYLGIDHLQNVYKCHCTKVPNPFYVDGVVGREI